MDQYANEISADEVLLSTQQYDDYGYDDMGQGPAQPSYVLNDRVKKFIIYFNRKIQEQNVMDVLNMYENQFNSITEHYFSDCEWPGVDVVAPLVDNNALFLTLYKELYYRHIYARLQPTLAHRFESYNNYCDLFNYVINNETPVPLELPNQWLWDIIDEFIYQFQAFSDYRTQLADKKPEEMELLQQNPQIWNVHSVVNVLHNLIDKSKINEQLQAFKQGDNVLAVAGEFGQRSLYKMLGYFSIIGLCRVHVLLADYHLALKVMQHVELNNKNMSSRVIACQVTAYYYTGFCYLMMRRYKDAVQTFASILQYIQRIKQYQSKSYQYDQILKKNEQMYALLAIAVTLCPQMIDDGVHAALSEKCAEKMNRMQREELLAFEELYQFSHPKFISPCPYQWDEAEERRNYHKEPYQHQLKMFLAEVKQQLSLPTIRSYLKLYTTMEVSKLTTFLSAEGDDVHGLLLSFKHKTRNPVWNEGAPLNGERKSSNDIEFFVEGGMVHIADTKVERTYSNYFVSQVNKFLTG